MEKGTKQALSWGSLILGILILLTQYLQWSAWLQYLWGILVVLGGVWMMAAK